MNKARRVITTSIALCLFCLSTSVIFAASDSHSIPVQSTESLIDAYKSQSKDTVTIDGNEITKIELSTNENVEVTGLTERQKENTDVYLIENTEDGYRTCYVEVPVAEDESYSIMPTASGSKSESKNYARINAYATIYYNTYKNGNTGYKPTSVGGRISYLPNSAQITGLSAQAFAQGAYLTNTGGSGFQSSQIASGKKALDVNKFSQNQSKSVASEFGNKYFVVGTTGTIVGAKLYVSYKLSGKYPGSFTVNVQL